MIELEVQALSLSREGLLMEVGRIMLANGFNLVRQRLADDAHGVLLTMIVRGPERKQRALETALDGHERIISFEVFPFEAGAPRPHFAASRAVAPGYVPPPPVVEAAPVQPAAPAKTPVAAPARERSPTETMAPATPLPTPPRAQALEPEPEFLFVRPPAPAPAPAMAEAPYVEAVTLDADVEAVEKVLPKLIGDYPRIIPWIKKLEQSVADGARESSLQLAGQRLGAWQFERAHAAPSILGVQEALERIGVPALRALVELDHQGNQLHIRNSPLCTEEGRSSCKFFSGFLEGLLNPLVASHSLEIFALCCRSCGAHECVLAVME